MKNKLTVFGTIEFGRSKFLDGELSPIYLGGNGVISALAASRHVEVDLIGVIGTDMDKKTLGKRLGKKINTENVTQMKGDTFRWTAVYDRESQDLVDQEIKFGVYASYKPKIVKERTKNSSHILFSGSRPQLGLEVLSQLKDPKFVAVDVLLYHLENNFEASIELIKHADALFVNEKEYEYLRNKLGNMLKYFKALKYIFIKRGELGVDVMSASDKLFFRSKKKVKPKDPTNAGDVFSGTILGMIAGGYLLDQGLEDVIEKAMTESVRVLKNNKFYRKPLNPSVLHAIITDKQDEIKTITADISKRKTELRDFGGSLKKKDRIGIIAEIKKASPSAGLLRDNFDHKILAEEFEASGVVDAVSVITDKKYFQGDISFIRDVKRHTTLPVLRKDFIVDEIQIYQSYENEADAILLIVAVLSKPKLRSLLRCASKLGLDCLVEVHDEGELNVAIKCGAKIIGVNSRNLNDFSIDMNLFSELAKKIPKGTVKIAESGIKNNEDLYVMYNAGADAALIGSSLMKAKDIKSQLNLLAGIGGEIYAN